MPHPSWILLLVLAAFNCSLPTLSLLDGLDGLDGVGVSDVLLVVVGVWPPISVKLPGGDDVVSEEVEKVCRRVDDRLKPLEPDCTHVSGLH